MTYPNNFSKIIINNIIIRHMKTVRDESKYWESRLYLFSSPKIVELIQLLLKVVNMLLF
jgi:hypothetical protein